MATEFMAHFGPSYVETNHLSENNAVKYRLSLQGTNLDSTIHKVFCRVNGKDIDVSIPGTYRGFVTALLNNTGGLIEKKVFDIYGSEPARRSFQSYVDTLPKDRILCIMSVDAFILDTQLYNFMYRVGARSFPDQSWMGGGIARSSYAAIMNTTMKKICLENFVARNPARDTNTNALVEVTFDDINDIGATGIPAFISPYVASETTGNGSSYTFYNFMSPNRKPFTEFGLKTGDYIVAEAEMFVSKAAADLGAYGLLYIDWYDMTTNVFVSGSGAEARIPEQWVPLKVVVQVPENSQNLKFGAFGFHAPSSVNSGDIKIRNTMFYQVSRDKITRSVAFGVNGIRANSLDDAGNYENPVLRLLGIDINNQVTSNEFRERS